MINCRTDRHTVCIQTCGYIPRLTSARLCVLCFPQLTESFTLNSNGFNFHNFPLEFTIYLIAVHFLYCFYINYISSTNDF